MVKTTRRWLGHSLAVIAAATCSPGCSDPAAVGLDRQPASSQARDVSAVDAEAHPGRINRAVELGACENLRVPPGNRLALHVYAKGVQIYRWNGASWSFVAPSALLSADASGKGTIGTHYAGPTWESVSGSKVIGTVVERCTPDEDAIPWLLLRATSAEGPGVFRRVTFIQRVNTVGGNAPSDPGNLPNEEARVPYTTEYLFYRGE